MDAQLAEDVPAGPAATRSRAPAGVALGDDKVARIKQHVRGYAGADDRKAWSVLALTASAQAAVVALYLAGWTLPAVVLGALVIVRTFIVYHDAIHRSFFRSARWNDRLAMVLQLWTITPVKMWRANHLAHHGRFGDLGFRDIADTIFFTREQFDALPRWQRLALRVARTPLVFFPLLPLAQWLGEYPFRRGNPWVWAGLAMHALFIWQVSAWHALAIYLGMLTGLVLFHLQHGIERGYRAPTESWRFEHAAILGSTWVPVPRPLSWFTLGIEFHHIHHLHPGVPCYALARCHRAAPAGLWDEVTKGTWRNCLAAMGNVMWDTERGELAGWRRTAKES